jgi:hypothetical protein
VLKLEDRSLSEKNRNISLSLCNVMIGAETQRYIIEVVVTLETFSRTMVVGVKREWLSESDISLKYMLYWIKMYNAIVWLDDDSY